MSAKHFSESYREARERFINAARNRKACVDSYLHPQRGPDGEQLFVDVARIGTSKSDKVLVVISGTHGVEGFAGSACQTAWLTDNYAELPGICIYLIHALNPYGFAWSRRVTEDNVDLNRNFVAFDSGPLPANTEYRDLEPILNPRVLAENTIEELNPELLPWLAPDRVSKFKAAVGKGQYEFPKGIIFGGRRPTWSHHVLRSFIESRQGLTTKGCVIDVHTGLGQPGRLEIFTEESTAKFDLLCGWFTGAKVSTLGDERSLGYRINGSVYQAFTAASNDSPWHCVALEFGTISLDKVLVALQADNWLHCFAGAEKPLESRVRALMRGAFTGATQEWQDTIVATGLNVIGRALNGLMSGSPDHHLYSRGAGK